VSRDSRNVSAVSGAPLLDDQEDAMDAIGRWVDVDRWPFPPGWTEAVVRRVVRSGGGRRGIARLRATRLSWRERRPQFGGGSRMTRDQILKAYEAAKSQGPVAGVWEWIQLDLVGGGLEFIVHARTLSFSPLDDDEQWEVTLLIPNEQPIIRDLAGQGDLNTLFQRMQAT
jgi:hypothetical protein